MFKCTLPYLAVTLTAAGLAAFADRGRDDADVVLAAAPPAPLLPGERRMSMLGRNAVPDANRQARRLSGLAD